MSDICISTSPAGLGIAGIALIFAFVVASVRAIRIRAGQTDTAPSIWSVNVLLFFAGGVLAAASLACIRI